MGMPMALRQRISIGGPCVDRYSTRKKSSDANVNQFIIGRPPGSVTCRCWEFQGVQLEDNRRDILFRARRCFWGAHPMDAQEALRTIRALARIALDTDNDELSTDALADMLRRALQGVVVVAEKVLGK
jgi:hypothetical protein